MAVPSNDTFLAFNPAGVALMSAAGAVLTPEAVAADIASQLAAWDAGTENNQAGAAGRDMAPFQAAPSRSDGGRGRERKVAHAAIHAAV